MPHPCCAAAWEWPKSRPEHNGQFELRSDAQGGALCHSGTDASRRNLRSHQDLRRGHRRGRPLPHRSRGQRLRLYRSQWEREDHHHRMIVNIFYPDRGQIRVLGHEMSGARNHLIGYLPEERGLFRKMQVRPLLEFFGELRGGSKVAREVAAWLTRFDLTHCAERRVDTLSKGMSQRVQFIAAVIPEPMLLVLDDPFTGLDRLE